VRQANLFEIFVKEKEDRKVQASFKRPVEVVQVDEGECD
jgi:hypothetical protein